MTAEFIQFAGKFYKGVPMTKEEKLLAKGRADVAEGKRRAAAVWATLTDAEKAKTEAMRRAAETVLERTFMTGANKKGRVTFLTVAEAEWKVAA